jgi:CBS domain-containing protein
MKRSILTEKVARRGYHISREYSVDPLERLSLGEVMNTNLITVPGSTPVRQLISRYFLSSGSARHQGYPVVDSHGKLLGVITRSNLPEHWLAAILKGEPDTWPGAEDPIIAYDLLTHEPITAFPWESCRTAAERMALHGVGRLPIVSPDDPEQVIGIATRSDLLKARSRIADEEMRRERFIGARRVDKV